MAHTSDINRARRTGTEHGLSPDYFACQFTSTAMVRAYNRAKALAEGPCKVYRGYRGRYQAQRPGHDRSGVAS